MEDLDKTQRLPRLSHAVPAETEAPDAAIAKTAQLPRISPGSVETSTDKKKEDFRDGQSRVLQMIAANAPLSEILKRLVLLIEAQSPGMLCSVLLLSEDGEHVRHGAAPSLPDDYVAAIDGEPIGPKHGSCGTAMYRGEPVIVTDILSDPRWEDYRDLATASGLRACWSTPILSGRGKVLGSFAMYYSEPRTPTGEEAGLTNVATRIAGLALEHHAAKEILARAQADLAQATYAATTGKAAVSMADEVNEQLEAIVENATQCLGYLDEDEPDIANFREPLKNILRDGRHALEIISRIRPAIATEKHKNHK
jgi:signal transduction protein with GAF and PtsI domain